MSSWKNNKTIQVGIELNKILPKFQTLDQIAESLGISKQAAYAASISALGKLAIACRRAMKRRELAL